MIRGQQNKSVRWIAGAMLATGIAFASAGSAKATPIVVPVTKCGTTISSPGFYQVQNDLSSTQAPGKDCIDISASNVILDILTNHQESCNARLIKGDSTSKSPIGIHILKTAKNVFIEGQNVNIAGWGTGIEDEGSSNIGDDFNVTNNVNVGLLISGGTGSSYSNFFSGILQDSSGADCFPAGIQGPQFYGVELRNTTGAQIFNAIAAGNGKYGAWTTGGTSNRISLVNAGPATGGVEPASFWFGCDSNANTGGACNGANGNGTKAGKNNLVYDDTTDVFTSTGQFVNGGAQFGFVFEKGETGYIVTDNAAANNFIDMYAINDPTCAANSYFFNFAGFAVPSCINKQ